MICLDLIIIDFLSCHTIFHSNCITVYSYQQCTNVIIAPHPHQHSFSVLFYMCGVVVCVSVFVNSCDN